MSRLRITGHKIWRPSMVRNQGNILLGQNDIGFFLYIYIYKILYFTAVPTIPVSIDIIVMKNDCYWIMSFTFRPTILERIVPVDLISSCTPWPIPWSCFHVWPQFLSTLPSRHVPSGHHHKRKCRRHHHHHS